MSAGPEFRFLFLVALAVAVGVGLVKLATGT